MKTPKKRPKFLRWGTKGHYATVMHEDKHPGFAGVPHTKGRRRHGEELARRKAELGRNNS